MDIGASLNCCPLWFLKIKAIPSSPLPTHSHSQSVKYRCCVKALCIWNPHKRFPLVFVCFYIVGMRMGCPCMNDPNITVQWVSYKVLSKNFRLIHFVYVIVLRIQTHSHVLFATTVNVLFGSDSYVTLISKCVALLFTNCLPYIHFYFPHHSFWKLW